VDLSYDRLLMNEYINMMKYILDMRNVKAGDYVNLPGYN
jgi:hypothetical protein